MKIKIEVNSINEKQVEKLAAYYDLPDEMETQGVIEFMIEHAMCQDYELINDMEFVYD